MLKADLFRNSRNLLQGNHLLKHDDVKVTNIEHHVERVAGQDVFILFATVDIPSDDFGGFSSCRASNQPSP